MIANFDEFEVVKVSIFIGRDNEGRQQLILATPRNVNELRANPGYSNVDIFSYVEMTSATKYFRPDLIIGEGGFGVVYKGLLDETIRSSYKEVTTVAIKELSRGGFQGDKEWLVFFLSFEMFSRLFVWFGVLRGL